MPNTTNIRPVRQLLADHIGGAPDDWREYVGRLVGRRTALVHGNRERHVTTEEVAELRDLVDAILEIELSNINDDRRRRLLAKARKG
jgi:hypothetical protein